MSATNLLPDLDVAPPGFAAAQIVMALADRDSDDREQAKNQAAQAADETVAGPLPFPEPLLVSPDIIVNKAAPKVAEGVVDWRGLWLAVLLLSLAVCLIYIIIRENGISERDEKIARLEFEARYPTVTQFESQPYDGPTVKPVEIDEEATQIQMSLSQTHQRDILAVYSRLTTAERRVSHLTALLKAYHSLFVEHDRPYATQAMLECHERNRNRHYHR